MADLGSEGQRQLLASFVQAWERADVPALLELLTEDAQFVMPPLPAWFRGKDDVGRFFAERVFAASWRLVPVLANAQLGFGCYTREPDAEEYTLGAINLLTVRAGKIAEITGFLDPASHRPHPVVGRHRQRPRPVRDQRLSDVSRAPARTRLRAIRVTGSVR